VDRLARKVGVTRSTGKPLVFAAGMVGLAAALTAAAALVAPRRTTSAAERAPAPGDVIAQVERRPVQHEARRRAAAGDREVAVMLARRHVEAARAAGDPRELGRAQAALARWWDEAAPPEDVLLLRATIRQSQHDFAGARRDLDALIVRRPDDAQARLTRAVVATVMGDHVTAAADCARVGTLAGEPWASACAAPLATRDGGTHVAYQRLAAVVGALDAAIPRGPAAPAGSPASSDSVRSATAGTAWATTALGELARAADDDAAAERHLRRALALAPGDVYTLAALADLLLDAGRPGEAAALLDPHAEPDGLRLRLAIASRRAGTVGAGAHAAIVRRGLDAAAARGDTTHLRERARYFLDVAPDAGEALAAARGNWDLQREAADARLLLEAATAAGDPAAATPVLRWLDDGRIDDAVLTRARAALEAP
jgi:Tfp pilus assembly protein PilF